MFDREAIAKTMFDTYWPEHNWDHLLDHDKDKWLAMSDAVIETGEVKEDSFEYKLWHLLFAAVVFGIVIGMIAIGGDLIQYCV